MGQTDIHLCGFVLMEPFFCLIISPILTGMLPGVGIMMLFCTLLGIFATGTPGVPCGTVMASLDIVTNSRLWPGGNALLMEIFGLQDSFGTACNVTSDGALTLMRTGYAEKHNTKEEKIEVNL